jgi:hypothetical protein
MKNKNGIEFSKESKITITIPDDVMVTAIPAY